MARYCDRCESRPATRATEELPDAVKWCYGKVCPDCYGELAAQGEAMGLLMRGELGGDAIPTDDELDEAVAR